LCLYGRVLCSVLSVVICCALDCLCRVLCSAMYCIHLASTFGPCIYCMPFGKSMACERLHAVHLLHVCRQSIFCLCLLNKQEMQCVCMMLEP
jgi:hypothetical protein